MCKGTCPKLKVRLLSHQLFYRGKDTLIQARLFLMPDSTLELNLTGLLASSTWIEHKRNPVCRHSSHHMTILAQKNITSGTQESSRRGPKRTSLAVLKMILTGGAFRNILGHVLNLVLLLPPLNWPPETRKQLIFVTIIMIIITIRKRSIHKLQLLTNGTKNVMIPIGL